jgi:hypothetical protein
LLSHHHHLRQRSAPSVTVTITVPPNATVIPVAHTSAPALTPSPAVTAAPAGPPPSTSAPPPSQPASPSPTPTPGILSVSPTLIKLAQSSPGGPYTGAFTITTVGGPVSYSISVPASEQAYLSMSTLNGTIKAGGTRVITATVLPNPNGPQPAYYNAVTISPGGITVVVYYPPSG